MKRIFTLTAILATCLISSKLNAQKTYDGELFVDSISVSKNTIGVYGKCTPVGVETTIITLVDEIPFNWDTIYPTGSVPYNFNIRITDLYPATDYYVRLKFHTSYGWDSINLSRITTLSDNHNGNILRIRNTLLTRNMGSSKVELRGIIDLQPKSTATAYCAIYSDSTMKKMIGNTSTKLNYNNPYPFEYMYSLYYNFNIDTNMHADVYGKFWGSDNFGHFSIDTVPVKIKILAAKPTVGLDEVLGIMDSIYIYPNPVKDRLFFSVVGEYQVFNIFGQIIRSGYGDQVDLSDLPIGMYVISINEKRFQFAKN